MADRNFGAISLVNQQDDLAVASTNTSYGTSIASDYLTRTAAIVQLGGAGLKSVQVWLEQSTQAPTTEGSSDSNYVVIEGGSALTTITDTNVHNIEMDLKCFQYSRLKFIGTGANAATTTVSWKLSQQERSLR